MRDLSDFQIPHDPRAPHQLHWEPGREGKGLIDHEGNVHTWKVDGYDGMPSHLMYKQARGIEGSAPSEFWIRPNGEMQTFTGFAIAPRATQIDPRIWQGEPNDWHF